jgi:hypothetical protein
MRFVAISMIVLMPTAFGVITYCAPKENRAVQTAARLERAFLNEVGPQPDEEHVAKFLRQHGIPYHVDTRHRMISASLTNVESQGLVTTGVYLQFAFDEGGHLRSHSIQAVPTGP